MYGLKIAYNGSMRKRCIYGLIALCFFFVSSAAADSSLLSDQNNKFGMHVSTPVSDEDLLSVSNLVNSNGGQWGYIMIVLQRDDYNRQRWQELFDKLRAQKLIPCIRIATTPDGPKWRRPTKADAYLAAHFLSSLNWPTKMQCVVLFNEPNQGHEWGGSCDARDYADRASFYIKAFKQISQNFFVMLAGFDQAAPESPPAYCDEAKFIQTMKQQQPDIFDRIDGWSSHSYPNPGFSASPTKRGRGSIAGYEWELQLIGKDLPVFITETGWVHGSYDENQLAENYRYAFERVWGPDDRVKAVMPFIMTYIGEPFEKFSWRTPAGTNNYFPMYDVVKSLVKVKGNPQQIQRATILAQLPKVLVRNSTYQLQLWIRNDGQAIWDRREGYEIRAITKPPFDMKFSPIFNVIPSRSGVMTMLFNSGALKGPQVVSMGLYKDNVLVVKLFDYSFEIVDEPSIQASVKVFPGFDADGTAEFLLYDSNERLVFKATGVLVKDGLLTIDKVKGVTLGDKHRAVIILPSYLPRQTFMTFKKGVNGIAFKQLLPGDFNKDGKWSIEDVLGK